MKPYSLLRPTGGILEKAQQFYLLTIKPLNC